MPGYWSLLRSAAFAVGALIFGSTVVRGATLYVDGQISSASCTTYAPASRSCSGGSDRGYRTVAGASSAAVAGDTVYLRGGTYGEALTPARSGTASQPITFAAYPGETPTLSGLSGVALSFTQRSYIVVDGLTVTNVGGWGRLEDSSYNTIRNCTFTLATIQGTTGGLKLVRATYNKILDNTIDDGNDNIVIQESDRNVVQGNTVSQGRHSLLSLRCGNYNVVRGNTFSNPDQKDLEIYDCEGTSDAPVKLDATKRNLVDGNVIADTRSSSSNYDYNGIQFGGQQGIVRRNVFRDDLGGGINFQYYSDESLYNNRNRVYHNTFYNNRCYGIVGNSGDGSRYFDNRARNNLLYKNTTCSGGATQVSISNPSQVILADNALATTSPGFVNEGARDLELAPGSPMIDAAAFLTTATAAGSGTQITVADASYFFDGYGIPGELGDEIQLQGQTTVARVLAVDLTANRLTLDRSLSWTAGLGVALRFGGTKPDLGAFESDSESLPFLSVGDVSVTEGHSGSTTATFTVTLSAASTQTVTVSYSTANGSATAGSDYTAASGSLSFSPGATSRTVAVSVTGDTAPEGDEDFFLNLSSPTNATLGDGQGRATILNDDTVASTLSIANASTTEGNSGTKSLVFTVTLSPASTQTVSVSYATANGTAAAGSDYVAQSGNLSFTAGQTSKTLSVTINGDTTVEPNETFLVNLSSPSGATLADGQAQGTITNDDSAALPTLSINNLNVTEGNSGTKLASFTVTLSAASTSTVTVAFATANGTATAGSDYVAQSGNLSFTAGQTSKTISVTINGDTTVEANETFLVNLSSPSGATLADGQGQATITNDDSTTPPTGAAPVAWISPVGVTVKANSLTKTTATGTNSGAASTQQIIAGDGHVEFTASETSTYRLIGLSRGNTDATYRDIDFAVGLTADSSVRFVVLEKGVLRGYFGTYKTGDVFRVAVVNGIVKYSRNGTVFCTSTQKPSYPLLVDSWLYSRGATISNAMVAGAR